LATTWPGSVFDAAKSIDGCTINRVPVGGGQQTSSPGCRTRWTGLISALGKAIYFPFLAPVVILGAVWLAWQG